jgi:hypothetical protein
VLEGRFVATLTAVLETAERHGKLRPEHKEELTLWLVIQLTRTVAFREQLLTLVQALMQQRVGAIAAARFADYQAGTVRVLPAPGHERLIHAGLLFSEEAWARIGEVLHRQLWMVVRNDTARPFYTSDTPVVLWSHAPMPPDIILGVGTPGIEIFFPLSPRYGVVVADRRGFRSQVNWHRKVRPLADEEVDYYNWLQASQSRRWVFCSADHFEQVRRVIANEGGGR